ncbi:glycosyltransferase involved in cell wall biosynthesis [Christiangramia gaetbulicola]|uniref:Glycosyltransferase involved in cell wall biosynthesis n=1 Tax=Christiangramia gaetbulicola TaxID=703340 RepID=A0A2T6AEX7_9FLAO|nr:glycosyltransferase involved in cell wall biosynthesis [Christiangramia gaetbulicola]
MLNDHKIKILHLSAVKNWGGGENHIENLCSELNEIDPEIENTILCVRNSAFHKKIKNSRFQVESAPLTIKMDLRYAGKILSLSKKQKIDLIHIHDSTALTLAIMATKLGKLPPYVLSKKTSFPIKDRGRTLYKYNHENIKRIFCVSKETQRITSEKIEDPSKLTTIYHGTSLDKKNKHSLDLREEFKIPGSKVLVGTIANHIRAKNLNTWIEMIDYLVNRKKINDFHFVLIGSHTNRTPAYKDKLKKLGLLKQVSITGFIENASALIPQFDISILTSQSEGVPQFIFESFYYKVPVVSTNVGGIPEIIEYDINGMLTNPHEPQSLADKLIALSQDKVLRNKFAERSYKKLIENFTTRKMAEQTLAEYKKVLYGTNGTGN